MGLRKQSTSFNRVFSFVSVSLTSISVTISKNGGSFGSPSGSLSNLTGNFYVFAGASGDADTLGDIAYKFSDTILGVVLPDDDTADQVVVALPGEKIAVTLAAGDVSGNLPVDLQTIKTQAVTCAAGVTVGAFVGNAGAALAVDASGNGSAKLADSVTHGGTAAIMQLDHVVVAAVGTNVAAVVLTGNGAGAGLIVAGGSGGPGFTATGNGGGPGFVATGNGGGNGISANGNGGGAGLSANGSSSNDITGNLTGTIGGFTAAALAQFFTLDTTKVYADAIAGSVVYEIVTNVSGGGGGGATAAQIWNYLVSSITTSGSIGKLLKDDIDTTISSRGTSTLTQTQVTGGAYTVQSASCVLGDARVAHLDADVSSRMATYTQPTGFLAATFPSGTVANTTNITGGTITTVTNLTNAPTAGDFTSTMKTSLNAATPASVVGAVGSVAGLTASDIAAIKAKTDQFVFTIANQVDANALSGGGGLDAAGVRAAVGLASANLDTQLAEIEGETDDIAAVKAKTDNLPASPADETLVIAATDAIMARIGAPVGASISADIAEIEAETDGIAAIKAETDDIAAIKAKTDSLTFTVAGKVDSNVVSWLGTAVNSLKFAKATALSKFAFLMVSATTGQPMPSLSINTQRSIDGGAFTSCSNGAIEISNGVYMIDLTIADLSGTVITLRFTATGAADRTITIVTQ